MVRLVSLATLALLPLSVSAAESPGFIAGVFDPPRDAPAVSLTGSDGSALQLSDYRGKVVVLYFGFTSCPDVCPTTLGMLATAMRRLGEEASDVQVVYITVDPETDTPERMRNYLRGIDKSFIGGTGSDPELEAVRREYGVIASREPVNPGKGSGTTYAHSAYTFLIDRDGRIRALMPYGRKPDDFVHDLRLLLGEP